MKKIMFMIESMVVGGAEKALINIVNNLDKTKYDVTVLSMFKYSVYDGYDYKFNEMFNKGVKVKYLIDNNNKIKYKLFSYLYNKIPKNLTYKYFIKEKYDLEVAFYEGFPTVFLSNSINKQSKKIAWLHTDSKNAFGHLDKNEINEIKKIYSKYDSIVGVSNSVTDSFKNIIGNEEKLITKYNIVETKNIIEKSKEDVNNSLVNKKFKMITIGRVIPVKGYDRLLKCVKRLKNEGFDFELWVVGDGSEKCELQKYIKDNNLQNIVKLLGFQSNPYKYLRHCDLFVCSSIAEGFSTVATEALVLGKPIVTTNCSGMKELFGENECGIITENNIESLYEGLRAVLDDEDLFNHFKEEAIKRSKFFSLENGLKEMEGVL